MRVLYKYNIDLIQNLVYLITETIYSITSPYCIQYLLTCTSTTKISLYDNLNLGLPVLHVDMLNEEQSYTVACIEADSENPR